MGTRMDVGFLTKCLGIIAVAALSSAAAQADVVNVDCTKKSVQDVIDSSKAAVLEIQITGPCHENLVITRSDLTLRGMDASASFQGVGTDPGGDHAVILIKGGSRIRIEDLVVNGGSRFGLNVKSDGTTVTVVDTDFTNNARAGINVSGGSLVDATNVTISGGLRGYQVFEAGLGFCHACSITATGPAFLVISARGAVDNFSDLHGNVALSVSSNATVGVTDTILDGASYAIYGESSSQLQVVRGSVDGSVFLFRDSMLTLQNADQTIDPQGETVIDAGSTLELVAGASLLGPVNLFGFSKAVIPGGGSIGGSLACFSASDAWCANPATIGGTTSDCDHCVKP